MAVRYIALIPAYEPDEKMTEVAGDLAVRGFEVVIVDDGSGPEYAETFAAAEEYGTVLTHRSNRGKGAALRTGLEYIQKYKPASPNITTVVVTLDADGQHLAGDVMRIARIAAGRPGTMVLGSRALREGVPLRSRLGNTITRHVYHIATGVSVHDTQTGLRAFTSDLIPRLLNIRGDRYEYEINVLMELAREGIPIAEEEIETVYLDNNSASHFNTVKDSLRVYREILKFSASSFISFIVDYGMYALLLACTGLVAAGGHAAGTAGAVIAAWAGAYGLVISNIGARLVSSAVNYTINRRFVFASRKNIASSAAQYFGLAAFILAGNTVVLSTLVGTFGMSRMLAKIITEIVFFSISWLVQKYVIFYREPASETGAGDRAKWHSSQAAGTAGRAAAIDWNCTQMTDAAGNAGAKWHCSRTADASGNSALRCTGRPARLRAVKGGRR